MEKEVQTIRVGFGGELPNHKRPVNNDERVKRGHQQRELRSYLKGGKRYRYGSTIAGAPAYFLVRELRGPYADNL